MQVETARVRQHFETNNVDKLAKEIIRNSDIYNRLQQVVIKPDDPISYTCKNLISAMSTALLKGEAPDKLIRRIARKRSPKLYCLYAMTKDEAKKELAEVKRLRKLAAARTPIPGARKLEHCHIEIVTLHQANASYRDIQFWLQANKGLKVSHHSIQRYLKAVLNHESQAV